MTSCSTCSVPATSNDLGAYTSSIDMQTCVPIQSSTRKNGAPPFRDSPPGVRANHHRKHPHGNETDDIFFQLFVVENRLISFSDHFAGRITHVGIPQLYKVSRTALHSPPVTILRDRRRST